MQQPLDFQRKKTLASGLIKLLAGLFLLKSTLVVLQMASEGTQKMALVGLGMLGPLALIVFAGITAVTKPKVSLLGLMVLFPVLSILQISFIANLFEMSYGIGGIAIAEQFPLMFSLLLLFDNPDLALVRWANRFPKTSKWFKASAILMLCFIWLEFGLRGIGLGPNDTQMHFNHLLVDSLIVYNDFEADESGIVSYSPRTAAYFDSLLSKYPTTYLESVMDTSTVFHNKDLYQHYVNFNKGTVDNEFSRRIAEIKAKPIHARSEIESAWLFQTTHPLNENGFRSIPFRNYATTQKKVLLIGDSFTWGYFASNLTSSFADNLSARGYVVFNAGISATDPAQYEAIAKKYIPILKPDAVVVNFYMGNDIFHFRREIMPHRLPIYHTNAGVLIASPCQEWLPSAQVAYDFLKEQIIIPHQKTSWFNALCAKTAVTTFLWRLSRATGYLPNAYPNGAYWERCKTATSKEPISGEYLESIQSLCDSAGAKFILAVIPEMVHLDQKIPDDFPGLFDGLSIAVPQLIPQDYSGLDPHFNDQGHRKYADFLQKELEARFH